MKTTRNILERKWKLINTTFFFTDQKDFNFLFTDFQNYIQNTPQLHEITQKLLSQKVIPIDFFDIDNENKSWKINANNNSNRADFNLLTKIYVFLLNEIDLISKKKALDLDKVKPKKSLRQKKPILEKNSSLDFFELPSKYSYTNEESLIENKYIDDNSLFVYFCISRGLFDIKDKVGINFIFLKPFEWTSVDFISFLLSACRDYDLEIENIKTIIPAIEDDYEISYEPRKYRGAYRWIFVKYPFS